MEALADSYQTMAELEYILTNKWRRLNSLYWILDKRGDRVKFHCNSDQQWLFENLWYRNIILKERRRGFTTFIDLYILDECLFNANVEGAIICHRLEAAKRIFRRGIKFPYDNLPEEIKAARQLQTESKSELAFPNGSIIYVDTGVRSGTLNYLHISELGEICAKEPQKAKEIISGGLPTVFTDQVLWIESTAQGREGSFYDICIESQNTQKSGRDLSPLEFRFFFVPWYRDPDNTADVPVPLTKYDTEYFDGLEALIRRTITDKQRWWYVAMRTTLKDEMLKQYPSTPEEAFQAAVEGAYYSAQCSDIRRDKRICKVPIVKHVAVNTAWDLGWDDSTCIWLYQVVGKEIHLVDYYENHGEGLLHYAKVLDQKAKDRNFSYGRHIGPHDIEVHELGPGKSRIQQARELRDPSTGKAYPIHFEVAARIESQADGIEAVRNILPRCWFDEVFTQVPMSNKKVGYPSIENYRKEWDARTESFKERPLHNWASHGAKAFETLAIGLPMEGGSLGDLSSAAS